MKPETLKAQQVAAYLVPVDNRQFEAIANAFECSTRNDGSELILDCIFFDWEEEREVLRKILELPDDTEIPTSGYFVFYC